VAWSGLPMINAQIIAIGRAGLLRKMTGPWRGVSASRSAFKPTIPAV
jgi:hypothetical protein